MDPLVDALDVARVSGAVAAQVVAAEPWGLRVAPATTAALHAITAGSCWIRVEGQEPRRLTAGDVILLPAGSAHTIASAPNGPARPFDRVAKEQLLEPTGDLVLSGPGAVTRFLCAHYDHDRDVAHPLLGLLPELVHLPGDPSGDGPLAATLRLVVLELQNRGPGSGAILDRLIDVVLVHLLRRWLADYTDGAPSWLRALRDPIIRDAIAALHGRPERAWTVQSLAAEVGVSRATLARRFPKLVGQTPLAYLTEWRMDLAARQLRDTADPVDAVARSVGYSSEFAFSRAFSRARGLPPGRYRTRHQRHTRPDPAGASVAL